MIIRRKTRTVEVGSVKIGSGNPVVIQSMTKVPTTDIDRCVRQVKQLVNAGCGLVRIAVPRKADTAAFAKIVQKVNVPLIADIHFSPDRAIEAIEAGAAKIRLNPGNIKNTEDILRIIDAAKMHNTAIRVGINEASIADYQNDFVPQEKRTALMLDEMKKYIRLFEGRGFEAIVLSVKSTDPLRTIQSNRSIAEVFDYPIHLGLTHAGLPEDATIPSAVCLGCLLAEGIGDTIRVSVAGNPVEEAKIARQILTSLELCERTTPELIVCPTCGRAEINVVKLARQVAKEVGRLNKPLRIAVMGCVVNGPGEAANADVALCAGKDKAYIYKKGRRIAVVPESKALDMLLSQLQDL
jgi:(E)-4-hydroxy-3-methylbut-2-enyl-diphosphate synthase